MSLPKTAKKRSQGKGGGGSVTFIHGRGLHEKKHQKRITIGGKWNT